VWFELISYIKQTLFVLKGLICDKLQNTSVGVDAVHRVHVECYTCTYDFS
jgi:hypothetical protein